MDNREVLETIRDINLSYLLLAKHMLNEDYAEGLFKLGISAQLADILHTLTPAQTIRLAQADDLVCDFRFDDAAMLTALTSTEKGLDATATHAAILLAAQPARQFA
ncbi:Flagellar transcriptional regulator FlhD [Trinickia soli]|uniref:Flagellar transcriptional regulator FlhD n=1 Tax=Trinickia soli TaxID=380675 RepID=A0A2N7VZ29_9BURK|nr:flagellar transcriptional regulator FlhD [Trinickia soli]KAA0088230.1 flagellar transcriptional regulator FlhD [Paraburkholderia sp. T12-10]PMS22400.1 flagellar transcriptional regulator FlhD [Trinickia soli]CAB3705789.1 Flagellar transcriptional regulator FlhD [Trinickia soli]